jgi:hypothetical protein
MTLKPLLINLGKLLLCALAYEAGMVIGRMIATFLKLTIPTPPAGANMNLIAVYMVLVTPLFALALAVIGRGLKGNFITRTLVLSFFMWISYTVNTQLEASIVSSYATGVAFAVISGVVPALFCSAAVAFLFSEEKKGEGLIVACKEFFARRSLVDWIWRLPVAAVAFMPIYFVFGLMVLPFTGKYYQQNMFGLAAPTIGQLLPTLFIRSLLFMLVCLPILILWKNSKRSLFWRLGLSLFMLVGFNIMLIATWLPIYVRFPHTLEILADEFVYAGVLVLLGFPRQTRNEFQI